jgi:hypothetical protein
VLVQAAQLQLFGPPACVRRGSSGHVLASIARERALCFGCHVSFLWLTALDYAKESRVRAPIDQPSLAYRVNSLARQARKARARSCAAWPFEDFKAFVDAVFRFVFLPFLPAQGRGLAKAIYFPIRTALPLVVSNAVPSARLMR